MKIYGIRHHGPGSTKSLIKALRNQQPDCIIIEGATDGESLISDVSNEGLIPPVALLTYNPKDFSQAVYAPFATFSPEWQTIKFGLKKNIPVRFMDLPYDMIFGIKNAEKENTQLALDIGESEKEIDPTDQLQKDPLGYMAQVAGYSDSERWWEVTFEERENPDDIFPEITNLMRVLRAELDRPESMMEMRREAYMRETIRKAKKESFENMAVICGAWHSPVLEDIDKFKSSEDKKLLKGIKKIKTKSTWVPWSYSRLSMQSGYGAGVISPAWYKLLFGNRKETGIRWMTKVARLFREKDMDASSAHVIEAVRLANTLAGLRQLPIAGIKEMYEAAVSIFCEGDEAQMKVIHDQLIIGNAIGKVPPEIPVIPLQQDFEKIVKSARLSAYKEDEEERYLKATKTNPRGGLDLRTDSDLKKSWLLHRLNILGIPWGKEFKTTRKTKGSFKEIWKLKWKPDFTLNIIEAGMWGNTVYNAAVNFVKKKVYEIKDLPQLTELTELSLKADLIGAVPNLVAQLKNLSALTKDVDKLMDALQPLQFALRYGDTRKQDVSSLQQVFDQLVPRICLMLPNACVAVNEEVTNELFDKIIETNSSITLNENEEHIQLWNNAIARIADLKNVNSLLQGGCIRILFNKGLMPTEEVANRMRRRLSVGNDKKDAAVWLEGFLRGSGVILVVHPELWNILDRWIEEIDFLSFKDLLPLLRRTFSEFSHPERAKMMELAKKGQVSISEQNAESGFDEERGAQVLPTIKLLLGIEK